MWPLSVGCDLERRGKKKRKRKRRGGERREGRGKRGRREGEEEGKLTPMGV